MENYDYMTLYKHHWYNYDDEKDLIKLVNRDIESVYISKASMEGWEIKATSILERDNSDLEIIHLQRKSSHPNFYKETFDESFFKHIDKIREEGKILYSDDDNAINNLINKKDN